MSQSANAVCRSVILKHRPAAGPRRTDFEIRVDAVPTPGAGEVVTRTIWLSIDPYMRGRLREQQTYAQPVNPGDVMTGETVGEVIASAHADFVAGDVAVGARGWQTHCVTPGDRLTKLDRHGAPLSAYLGVLGMPGATAYRGVTEIGSRRRARPWWSRPRPARLARWWASLPNGPERAWLALPAGRRNVSGCRTVSGSTIASITARSICARNWRRRARMASISISRMSAVRVQAAVFDLLNPFARVAMCGMVSQYNEAEFPPGPNLGFVVGKRVTDPGVHRFGQAGTHRRVAQAGGALGGGRQPGVSRGRGGRAGERAGRAGWHARRA